MYYLLSSALPLCTWSVPGAGWAGGKQSRPQSLGPRVHRQSLCSLGEYCEEEVQVTYGGAC